MNDQIALDDFVNKLPNTAVDDLKNQDMGGDILNELVDYFDIFQADWGKETLFQDQTLENIKNDLLSKVSNFVGEVAYHSQQNYTFTSAKLQKQYIHKKPLLESQAEVIHEKYISLLAEARNQGLILP